MRSKTVKILWISAGAIFIFSLIARLGRGVFESKRLPVFIQDARHLERDLAEIRVARFPFGESVLAKQGDSWRLISPSDYPADQTSVKEMMDALKSASLEEKISQNADRLADFELDAARAIALSLKNKKGELILNGRIGKQVLGSWDRSYFSFAGSSAVYIAKGLPRYQFDKRPDELRSRLVFAAPGESLTALTLEVAPRKPIRLVKTGDSWKIAAKTVKEDKANEIFGIFSFLEANEFADAVEMAQGLKKLGLEGKPGALKAKLELAGGKKYELWIGNKKDTVYYAKLADSPTIWKLAEWKVAPLLTKETDLLVSAPPLAPSKKAKKINRKP
ncbi:MAG: DUF4340 domain-containing protein [Elusimicrobia bacterium]|nr:DUF4340 domain-containing protein [Elusimicrobiota bacterium]